MVTMSSPSFIGYQAESGDIEGVLHPEPGAGESNGEQDSVFVHDVKVVDCPENVVPSLVGLHTANSVFNDSSHSLYFSLDKLHFILLGLEFDRINNRECGVCSRFTVAGQAGGSGTKHEI